MTIATTLCHASLLAACCPRSAAAELVRAGAVRGGGGRIEAGVVGGNAVEDVERGAVVTLTPCTPLTDTPGWRLRTSTKDGCETAEAMAAAEGLLAVVPAKTVTFATVLL
jgi:hypothetical protein